MALELNPICDLLLRLNMELERQGLQPLVSIEVTAETGRVMRSSPRSDLLEQEFARCHEAGYCATICGVPLYTEARL
jgi:hypothetical protein